MSRTAWALAALMIAAAGCGGGTDGTPATPPTAPPPAPTPVPPPEPEPPAVSFRIETGVDKAAEALGVSGEGVIVAMLDRGIDWENNDFRNSDGSTRIAYIFDMGDDSGADAPGNAYGRGTIYTREQIDQALFSGTRLATTDVTGHGSGTTGIATGNGRNSPDRKYRGVAPNATIISVKVTGGAPAHGNKPGEPYFDLDTEGYSVAMDFVVDKAGELSMPAVMLLNLGSIGGPTDGTSALSRKIDATVGPDHPGIVFVTGTGDDGIPSFTQLRAGGEVPNGGTLDLRFELDTGKADSRCGTTRIRDLPCPSTRRQECSVRTRPRSSRRWALVSTCTTAAGARTTTVRGMASGHFFSVSMTPRAQASTS